MKFFVDIGELGWSLYLSAHIKWLNRNEEHPMVITYKDRMPLYECPTFEPPDEFKETYGQYSQDGFGLYGVKAGELEQFFKNYFPAWTMPSYFTMSCTPLPADKLLYTPYDYSAGIDEGDKILIFPRFRKTYYPKEELKHKHPIHYEKRNLPKVFYQKLAYLLAKLFPNTTIYSIGHKDGAYDLDVQATNFINLIGQTDLQDLIDLCKGAKLAIGGTSAPPKITMLQGVPTVVIGHEKKRFEEEENWGNTDILFYTVPNNDYQLVNIDDCIKSIMIFARKVK